MAVGMRSWVYTAIIEAMLVNENLSAATIGCNEYYVQKIADSSFVVSCTSFQEKKSKKFKEVN